MNIETIAMALSCGKAHCSCGKVHGGNLVTHCPAHDDGQTSLSVTQSGDKMLVKCHAGCSQADVVDALKARDLWPKSERPALRPSANQTKRITDTYSYEDESGGLLYQVQRSVPKSFSQRHPDPDRPGKFVYNMDGVRRVVYRLPEILSEPKGPVFVVEGEKDADRLHRLGLLATTNVAGAGKWMPEYSKQLAGRHLVLIPDNDEAGRSHVQKVAEHSHGVCRTVRVLSLPGLSLKGDVSEWLDSGGDAKQLYALAAQAPLWEPPSAPPVPTTGLSLTDYGNGLRFVGQHGENLRFVHAMGQWVCWRGSHWSDDETGEVYRMAYETSKSIYAEAASEPDEDRRKRIATHAIRTESYDKVTAMIKTAANLPGVPLRVSQMDTRPMLLNCDNGTLDLSTGDISPHRRSHYITKRVSQRYDPNADCPTWKAFLARVLAMDPDLIAYIQRAVGYCLTGDTREEAFFVLYGAGRNGKSTFIETLRYLLGDYATETPASSLMVKKNDNGLSNDIARLRGARFVSASESEDGERLASGTVKHITGRDTITARFLHKEFFEFRPEFKLFLATNHKPVIRDMTEGIWRRVHFIPFTVTIPEDEVDKGLGARLREEAPGILAWAVQGCAYWLRDGLGRPDVVRKATHDYRVEMDTFGTFLEEMCVEGEDHYVKASDLYQAYKGWCEKWNEHAFNANSFGRKLTDRGFVASKPGGVAYRNGLGLKATRL